MIIQSAANRVTRKDLERLWAITSLQSIQSAFHCWRKDKTTFNFRLEKPFAEFPHLN